MTLFGWGHELLNDLNEPFNLLTMQNCVTSVCLELKIKMEEDF